MQPQDPNSPGEQPVNTPAYGEQPPVIQPNIEPTPQQAPMPEQQTGATVAPNMTQPAEPVVAQVPPEQYGAPQPQYQQQPAPQPQVSAEDPGKTLSILGICLFIIPIVGVSLSIIGMMKSKNSGYSGKLGKIGIITNILSVVLSLIFFVVFPFLFAKNAVDQLSQSTPTGSTNQTAQSDNSATKSNSELAVGMSKADVAKALGLEPGSCLKGVDPTTETCVYRDGTSSSDTTVQVNVSFASGKLTKAIGYADNGNKTIKVGY